jgi:hypothetical protein
VSEEHDGRGQRDGCCGDAALYLLGLLDEQHTRMLLEHAGHCSVCADELQALAPAADLLAGTVPQMRAPQAVKQQVMGHVRAQSTQACRRSRRPRLLGTLALSRPALALTAVCLLAAGVVIGGLSTPFTTTKTGPKEASREIAADVTLAGARATLHQAGGHTWLEISQMPGPASGHVYEVWVKYPGQRLPQPTNSLFTPTSDGTASVEVPSSSGASEVLVTQEPAGGSALPTSTPVITARLT